MRLYFWLFLLSLPSRECGLKFFAFFAPSFSIDVTPFAGVWIEIISEYYDIGNDVVTPFAGVWIEIIWH